MSTPTIANPIKVPARPRRRFLQVSLRTLLIVMLVVTAVFGWVGIQLERGRRTRQTILDIGVMGGRIQYTPPSNPLQRNLWLRSWLGSESILGVAFVDLHGRPLSDADLKTVTTLWELPALHLGATKITDDGLVHLRGLRRLNWLNVSNTSITDQGLSQLRRHTKLKGLYLRETGITSEGLANLEWFSDLAWLDLNGTQIDDAGLLHLRRLVQLEELDLNDTKVTDAGLVHLRNLKTLKLLYLNRTDVTDDGVAELQRAIPSCKIFQ